MTATVIKMSIQRMACTGCGAEANVSCNCGKPYIPAAQRVREYDGANPGKSTRQAAADLGITSGTVTKARKSGASTEAPAAADRAEPEARSTGKDGKSYPRKRITTAEAHSEAVTRRRVFKQCVADVVRKVQQGAGLVDALGSEIDDEILAEFDRVIEAWAKLRAEMVKRKEENRE